jgi:FkbM family methyltransferase
MKIQLLIFNKVVFNDSYGMRYYLWKNTRPIGTIQQGVRTDDSTVLDLADFIVTQLKKSKKRPLVCFDVGGFIGIVSLAILKSLDGKGIVHIFEPVRTNFFRISENIALNGYKNVVINNFALSNISGIGLQNITAEAGSEFLQILSDQSGEIKGYDIAKRSEDLNVSSKHLTKVSTLDNYMSECAIDDIDLLKIDAEWVDHLVVRGLGERLNEGRISTIIVEYNHGTEASEDLIKIFKEYRYTVFFLVRNEGKVVSHLKYYPTESKDCLNILAISNSLNLEVINAIKLNYLIK